MAIRTRAAPFRCDAGRRGRCDAHDVRPAIDRGEHANASARAAGAPSGLTELIHRAQAGDAAAADALFSAAYDDLRRLARIRLRPGRRPGTLDTSSLVHECYVRFAASGRVRIEDRVHFMRWIGRAMRSVIVDVARRRKAERRGGDRERVTLHDDVATDAPGPEDEILLVHDALDRVAQVDPRAARVVELRYFCGMTDAEAGEALGVTDRTVRRDWEKAQLLLRDLLA